MKGIYTHVIAAQKLTCCDALMRLCHLWRATNFFKTLFFIGSTLKTKTHLFFWCSKFQFSIWRLEWIVIWFKGLRNQRGGKKCNFRKADMALEVAKNSQLQNLFIKCLPSKCLFMWIKVDKQDYLKIGSLDFKNYFYFGII